MKIECPACHLTGNINSVDVPAEGRHFECPKCKSSFFITKPASETESRHLMSMCPSCQYSTFTEEMFAVCPECGTKGSDYQKLFLKKSLGKKEGRISVQNYPEEPIAEIDPEKTQRDYERLTRSHRNPEFASEPPIEEIEEKPVLPLPIRITGWAAAAAGAIFLCYGIAGLLHYFGTDWQPPLSETFIEPVSKITLFFKYGLFPWLRTLSGLGLVLVSIQFLALKPWTPKVLVGFCWGSIGLMLVQEIVGIVNRILITSGSPSAIFYVDCLVSYLIKVTLWSVPFLAIIWLLSRDETLQDYPET